MNDSGVSRAVTMAGMCHRLLRDRAPCEGRTWPPGGLTAAARRERV